MAGVTADRILDSAQAMMQTRGYHDVSYRDIADEIGIKTASIHYHFPSKTDLGVALTARYRERFFDDLAHTVKREKSALHALKGFAALFRQVMADNHFCLCGALGSEVGGLPTAVVDEVASFFAACEDWLAESFASGRANGALGFTGSPKVQASVFLSLMEGALLTSRSLGGLKRFDAIVKTFLEGLRPTARA